jgi:hypothetical protein
MIAEAKQMKRKEKKKKEKQRVQKEAKRSTKVGVSAVHRFQEG